MSFVRRACTGALLAGLIAGAGLTLPSRSVHAHGYELGGLRIDHPWSPPTPSGATTGAVYFKALRNVGDKRDQLIGARTLLTPDVELHVMRMEGDVMRMRAVPQVDVAPRSTVSFGRGDSNGYHVMLLNLKAPLKEGQTFPLWLRFQEAGEVEVKVVVQTPKSDPPGRSHNH